MASYKNMNNEIITPDIEFEQKPENQEFLVGMPKDLKDMDARKWAFKPGNPLAEFIACTRKLALKIGDYLFVHAGIVPQIAKKYPNIGDLNKLLSLYLWDTDNDGEKLIKNPELYQDIFGPDVIKGQTILNPSDRKHDYFKIHFPINKIKGLLKNNHYIFDLKNIVDLQDSNDRL